MKDTDRYMYAAFPSHKVPEQRTTGICRSLAPAGKLTHGVLSWNICHKSTRPFMTLICELPTLAGAMLQSFGSLMSTDSQRGRCCLADRFVSFIASAELMLCKETL